MRFKTLTATGIRMVAIGLLLVWIPGCSDDDDPIIVTGLAAGFTSSGTASAPDRVLLRQGAAAGDVVTLEVVVGGPSTSQDIYAFAFDLILGDTAVAEYVAGSAVAGPALSGSGLLVQAAPQPSDPSRIVVAVTKQGAVPGNGIPAGDAVAVSLDFRVLVSGVTSVDFGGQVSAQNPSGGPAALDSAGALIGSIQFDAQAAGITGG